MNLVGVLLIPPDAAVVADLERWNIRRTVNLAGVANLEAIVARRVKGERAVIFASFARRWVAVTEAIRGAALSVGGDLSLRFYQPTCTIDIRSPLSGGERYGLCVSVDEFSKGEGAKAYQIRRAVKDAIADLLAREMTQLADEIKAARVA